MRIVMHVFPSFVLGGSQSRFLRMIAHWPADIDHRVVSMDARLDAAAMIPAGATVRTIAFRAIKGGGLANRRALRALIGEVGPHCVVTYNWGAVEAMVANWPRITRHLHVEDGFGPDEIDRRLRRRSIARALALRLTGARVLVPSRTLADIAAVEWAATGRRQAFVPNGVRLPASDDPAASIPGLDPSWIDSRLLIGSVGALRREKRFDRLIDTLRDLPDCVAAIAGEGPERAALEARAAEAGVADRFRLLGQMADPSALYRALDVFVLSSDTEQLPMAMLEAMAHGLPVAATAVGDVPIVLSAANAPFAVGRDAAALAAAIRTLGADPVLRRTLGAANRSRVATDYAFETMCERWLALMLGD
jgi:glycosyltransferase involved in cell wall biosynthesis